MNDFEIGREFEKLNQRITDLEEIIEDTSILGDVCGCGCEEDDDEQSFFKTDNINTIFGTNEMINDEQGMITISTNLKSNTINALNLNCEDCISTTKGDMRILIHIYSLEDIDVLDMSKFFNPDYRGLGTGTVRECKIYAGLKCKDKTYSPNPEYCVDLGAFSNRVKDKCSCKGAYRWVEDKSCKKAGE